MRNLRSMLAGVTLAVFAAIQVRGLAAEKPWYRSPTLAIMTGFIYEPKSPYSLQEWAKGLGGKFDADRWVTDFQQAGASYLIFYDKWIDGFVFHDTKTTAFKTRRDFVRELADACRRRGLRLVLYFNAVSDGNPEFKKWAVHDRRGRAIVFSGRWPTGYQTLHSPFRKVSLEQVRELLTGYGRIDGLWLDIFGERLSTSSPWVARGYERMYGRPFAKADGTKLAEFNARTLAAYLDDVRALAAKHQPGCVWTANGSGRAMLASGVWAKWVGRRLDYGSDEGHHFARIDQLARMAWVLPKPTEIGLLVNSSWFCPLKDTPPPPAKTPKQAIAEAAVGLCQGASVYLALTPGHSGLFGGDLKVAKAVGAWFRTVEPVLRDARPYADVGIVLGAPAADAPGLPGRNTLWKRYLPRQAGTTDEALAISDALQGGGVFSRILYAWDTRSTWPEPLSGLRAVIVPERALLDDAHAERLRRYVKQGGRLVAFGHASMLDSHGKRRKGYALGDVFGVRYRGEAAFSARRGGSGEPPRGTQVKVDSEYSREFAGRHLVDGLPTAWASGGGPMPHWAEILLPEPADVAKVELVSRSGPYLVTDIDVEAHDGKTWKLVKSVRGAKARRISASLDAPVRTARIRVKILRELYQGKDRQYADVEAIRVFDTAGRDRSTSPAKAVAVLDAAPDLKRAFQGELPTFPAMAVEAQPTTAEAIARLDNPRRSPAILRNRLGRGEAILITTSEAWFRGRASFWAGLGRLTVGGPTLVCRQRDRYRIILTRSRDAHVLHVIDRTHRPARLPAADVTIRLAAARLGGVRTAVLVGSGTPLKTTQADGLTAFVLRPDPVASVVLAQGGRGTQPDSKTGR